MEVVFDSTIVYSVLMYNCI